MQTDSVEFTVAIPASLADADVGERARTLLVLDAVRSEKMTWRSAALALNLAPEQLLELARTHGVPVIRYESAELRNDLAALSTLEARRASGG